MYPKVVSISEVLLNADLSVEKLISVLLSGMFWGDSLEFEFEFEFLLFEPESVSSVRCFSLRLLARSSTISIGISFEMFSEIFCFFFRILLALNAGFEFSILRFCDTNRKKYIYINL